MSHVQCALCPNNCFIPHLGKGACRVRINIDGKLYSLVYGKPCAVHIDPIEKKPMFHFLPGSQAFSIATAGCCLSCKYCQNWQISQASPEDIPHYDLPPREVVDRAISNGCASIAYTYTDPIIFYEYMLDTAKIAREKGVKNVLVTCGYMNPGPLYEMTPFIDGANIDLKGFSENFYREVTGGSMKPVLESIKYMYQHGVIVELTNLVVPTLNDDLQEIKKMCEWIVSEVSPDVPLHFSRFQPNYKLQHLQATPYETLQQAHDVARESGMKYVYIGNVYQTEGQTTYCPQCRTALIQRAGYRIVDNKLSGQTCPECSETIYGHF